MAEFQQQISDVVGNIFGGSLTIGLIVIIGLIAFALIGGIGWYFFIYKKKFDIVVKVISRRSGENKEFFDKGGIFYDRKENLRYLRLLDTKVDLELPKFNILRKTNWGDYVEVLRESERGFRFLKPPVIDSEFFINVDGKKTPMTRMKHRQIEADISFILQRERKNKSIINPESVLMKVLQYLPNIISGVISLMVLWVVFRYVPDFLGAMSQFVQDIRGGGQPQIVGS